MISSQKQPSCKNGAALCTLAKVKKVGSGQEMDVMVVKVLITTIWCLLLVNEAAKIT